MLRGNLLQAAPACSCCWDKAWGKVACSHCMRGPRPRSGQRPSRCQCRAVCRQPLGVLQAAATGSPPQQAAGMLTSQQADRLAGRLAVTDVYAVCIPHGDGRPWCGTRPGHSSSRHHKPLSHRPLPVRQVAAACLARMPPPRCHSRLSRCASRSMTATDDGGTAPISVTTTLTQSAGIRS